VRFDYLLPKGQQFVGLSRQLLALSPDGSQFVYSTQKGLYLRSLAQTIPRLIPHTDQNSQQPVFSPDGKWICYWSAADNQLKKIAISGGAPITLCSALEPRRPTWSADDMIVFAQSRGIMGISSNGGTPELLADAEGQRLLYRPSSPVSERNYLQVILRAISQPDTSSMVWVTIFLLFHSILTAFK
jgi:Tol biopolymer transport system component